MAKKTLSNELKKEGKSVAKRSVKKGVKKTVKSTASDLGVDKKARKKAPSRPIMYAVLPYFIVVFALILAIFFITVHIAESDAGVVGNFIQYALGGLLGGAAILLPLVLGYFGVKWCIYNVKWKEESMDPDNDDYPDYKKARGRMKLQGIMAFLVILVVSAMFGVFAGFDASSGLDITDMWESGAEDLLAGGGGILGSTVGGLFVAGIKEIASTIVLIALLIVFVILMIGLTPDYIIGKINDSAERKREERKERKEEEMALAAMAAAKAKEEDEERRANRKEEPKQEAEPAKANTGKSFISKFVTIEKDEKAPAAVPCNESPEIRDEKSSELDSDDFVSSMLGDVKTTSRENGGDFGGEPGIDADGEFDPLEDILKGMEINKVTGEVVEKPLPDESATQEESAPEPLNLSELGNDELLSDMAAVAPDEADDEEEEEPPTPYVFPPIDMLAMGKNPVDNDFNEELQTNARQLVNTLQSFKINIKEINYSRGPTITRYELKPEAGVRVRSISNLVDDIAMNLATSGVRIEAPIPGKAAVGIEVPNRTRATVYLRELIDNPQFTDAKSRLTAALGMDVGGNPIYFDISKMPHMLIAGATGMGKSVCINCVIISLLYKARPEDLKLILIDPKKVEFNIYKDIPHLYAPIVSEPKKAAGALASAVAEMERRFELIEEVGVRDIASYNAVTENDPYKEHLPHMVIIIDELADLMMTAPDEVETAICRLAQKARAAGIHIIIGTQRPSVDVITGLIKANIPSRIACTVASQIDSRTIIDIAGAEKLIGRGDMLFAPVGSAKPLRVQGAFVTDSEVENIVSYIRDNNAKAKYNAEFINRLEEEAAKCGIKKGANGGGEAVSIGGSDEGGDSKFQAAVKLAVEEGKISTSLMQRRLGVGYGRAAKIIDTMEEMGYVSKPDGNKPRRVLLTAEEYARRVTEGTLGGGDDE